MPLMESRERFLISSTCTGEGQLTSVCLCQFRFSFFVYGTCVCICASRVSLCLWRPEEGIGSTETEVTVGYEWVLGTETSFSVRIASEPLSHLSKPYNMQLFEKEFI